MKPIKQFLVPLLMIFMVILGISPHTLGQGTQTFSTPGTSAFVVPPGVTSVTIKAWGAGGGGGSSTTVAQGGGGGGGYVQVNQTGVSFGQSCAVIVGAAGTAGNNGGSSSCNGSPLAQGGQAGTSIGGFGGGAYGTGNTIPVGANFNTPLNFNGGDAGAATNPGAQFAGGGGGAGASAVANGASGMNGGTSPNFLGGLGGAPSGGNGGDQGFSGVNGLLVGGGGGGRGNGATTTSGSGGDGRVQFTWPCPTLTSISYPSPTTCGYGAALTPTVLPVTAIGGTFTSTTLSTYLNATTGVIATGAPQGVHVITYGWPAFGGCPAASVSYTLTIAPQAVASNLSYTTPLCNNTGASNVSPSWGALSGATGLYTISPFTGLSINSGTGVISPSGATAGNYTVTYTVPGGGGNTYSSGAINLAVPDNVPAGVNNTITIAGSPMINSPNELSIGINVTNGHTWAGDVKVTLTSPGGNTIVFDRPGFPVSLAGSSADLTGAYTFNPSAPNILQQTNTPTLIPNGVYRPSNSANPDAAHNWAGLTFPFNPNGAWIINISDAGSLDIGTLASWNVTIGGCETVFATAPVTITALPTISNFDYPPAGTPNKYCAGAGLQLPTSTVSNPNSNAISYSATPSGLTLSATTGEVNPATSTPGVYVVTMTIAAGGGCAAVAATSTVEILARPTAPFSYASTPYCQTVGSVLEPIVLGVVTGGPLTSPNFTATPSGLTINATTGAINLNSAPGVYTVKYKFVGANGCLDSSSTSVTIKPRPTSTISYSGPNTICSNISPIVGGNITAVGAWTITLSNGQTATGTGNGPWSITVNTMNPGDVATFTVASLMDANCSGVANPDMPGSVTITKRTITSGVIDGASNVKVCEGQAASINVVLTSAANCAPNPRFSGVFAIEYWDGAGWQPHPTNPTFAWTSNAGASTSGTNAAISIPSAILNNPNSYTLQYRIRWVSLVDCNGCAADPLTGEVVVEIVPNPLLNVTAAPVGNVCPGTVVSFTVSQAANSYVLPQFALFNWVATRPNGSIIAQGQNNGLGTISFATPPCPFNDSVTVKFTPLNTSCCNCLYTPIFRKFAVRDTTAPVWSTAATALNRRLQCSDGAGLTAAQALFPVATDNCDTDVTNIVKNSGLFIAGNCPQAGTYTNTWTVTDECGNISATFTQVITIIDSIAPTWTTLAGSLDRRLQCSDAAGLIAAQALVPVATDNCDTQLSAGQYTKITGLFVAGSCPQAGTYTNTFTVKDDCNNVSTVFTQVITIIDSIAPTWTTLPGSLNRRLQCSDAAGLTAAQALFPVASDNCDANVTNIVKTAGAFVAGSCPQAGTYTNTWRVTDDCGNISVVFTQVITIIDSIAPTWTTAAGALNRRLQCSDAAGLTAAQALFPVASDNCDASVTNIVKTSGAFVVGSCPQAGTYTNTWTVTDDCGNTSVIFTQVITIIDSIAPTWTTAAGGLNRRLQCSDAAGLTAAQALFPVASDNCDANVTNIVKTSGVFVPNANCPQSGTYTNTWRVTDDCGNMSVMFTQVITVIDSIAPVLITAGTFPTGSTGLGINGCIGSAPAAPLDATIKALYTDNCGTVSVTHTGAPTGNDCNWTVTYTYNVTDNCGNAVTPAPSVTYYGSDRTAPIFTSVIPTQILNTGAGVNCSGIIPDFRPLVTFTDCAPLGSVVLTQLAPNAPGTMVIGYNGERLIKIEAKDPCGNKDTISFLLLLKDLTPPTVLCKDITINLSATGTVSITPSSINNGSYDNCTQLDSLKYAISKTNFTCANVGVNLVKLYVTDLCGNIDSCTARVTVRDVTAPVISCWGDTTINKDALCTYTMPDLTFRVNKSDACGIASVTQSVPVGTILAESVLTFPVTLTVTDVNGNVSTCTFTMIFKDVTAPVFSNCPQNITVFTGLGRTTCNQIATWTPPTAADACTHCCVTQPVTSNYAPGATFPVGVTTVTYSATDASGNTSTCVFTVTVIDNTAPVITGCPANVSVNTGAGRPTCDQTATWTEPTATDNCTAAASLVRYRSHAPGATFPVGVTMVKYAFKDAAGNTSDTCRFTVTVIDNTVPTITCPGNIVNPPINTAGCIATVVTANPTFNDNCAVTKLTWALTGVTTGASAVTGINYLGTRTFNFGVTTVTYTATDAAGNSAICSYTVSVTRPFTAAISGTSTVLQNNTGTANVQFTSQLGTAPYTIVYSTTAGGYPNAGTHTIVTNSNPVGGNSSIISGNPNWLVTTVPQSSAVPGTYTYTLVSVTDAYGCVVTPNTTAVVTVIAATYPAPDLTPNIANNGSLFLAPTTTKTGYLEIFNNPNGPGTNITSGLVTFDVFSPSNFTLNIANATTAIGSTPVQNSQFDIVYYPGIGYAIQTKPGVVIPSNSSLKVGYTITAAAGANNQGQFIVNIANQTGGIITAVGDNNDANNNTLKTFKIIN